MKCRLKQHHLASLLIFCWSCTHAVESGVPSFTGSEIGLKGETRGEDVVAQVKSKLKDLNLCYQQEKIHNPSAKGKIMLSFDVLADGRTAAVRLLASTLGSPVMEGCLVGKVEAWSFSPDSTGKPTHVQYPFSFQS